MLNAKQLLGFFWKDDSMASLFGVLFPFASCLWEDQPESTHWKVFFSLQYRKLYLVPVILPLVAQHAIPNPLGPSVIQSAHLQILFENPHPAEVNLHFAMGRHIQGRLTSIQL